MEDLVNILGQNFEPDTILSFQVTLKSFKLTQFTQQAQKDMYLGFDLGDDIDDRKKSEQRGGDIIASVVQGDTSNKSYAQGTKTMSGAISSTGVDNPSTIQYRHETSKFVISVDGSYEEMNPRFGTKFETKIQDIRKKFLIVEIFSPEQQSRPISILEIEFLALALGPKRIDLEVRGTKSKKVLGRLQLEMDIKQYQTMSVGLTEMQFSLNGQEERPLYSQFKVITNNDVPRTSVPTQTQRGKFKKDKHATKFKWIYQDEEGPDVKYDIAMETLKNSSVQVVLKVDRDYHEQQTELVLQKIKQQSSQANRGKTTIQRSNFRKNKAEGDLSLKILGGETRTYLHIREDMSINSTGLYGKPEGSGSSENGGIGTVGLGQKGRSKLANIESVGQMGSYAIDDPQEAEELSQKMFEKIQKGSIVSEGTGGENEKSDLIIHSKTPDTSLKAVRGENQMVIKKQGHASNMIKELPNNFTDSYNKNIKSEKKADNQFKSSTQQNSGEAQVFHFDIDDSQNHPQKEEELKQVQRRLSVMSKKSIMSIEDASAYYKKYGDENDNDDSQALIDPTIAECYLSFSKLLQSEMRRLDKRDSAILQQKMSISIKKNVSIREKQGPNIGPDQSLGSRFQLSSKLSENKRYKEQPSEKRGFEEQIWHLGKVVGTVKGLFRLSNIPVMQQMQLGILTDNGVMMNAAPILISEDKDGAILSKLKKQQRNQNITSLIELTKKLRKIDSNKDKKNVYKTYNDKEKIINDMITILADGDNAQAAMGNYRMFNYSNELDLIRGQEAMIDLAFHCLIYADTVRYEFKRDYYEILSQIFNRDELKLTNVALCPEFMEENKNSILEARFSERHNSVSLKAKDIKSQLIQEESKAQKQAIPESGFEDLEYDRIKQEKVKIAQFYQKLLFQILDDCLFKFCRKDVEPFMRSYIEICISIAFFRVPQFQKMFLDCVNKQPINDKNGEKIEISEWKNMTWSLEDNEGTNSMGSMIGGYGLMKLFDWQVQFYQHIPMTEQYQEALKFLKRIEANKKWQNRVQKRSLAYFQIIKRWTEFIQTTVQTNHVFWQDIPGYRLIVKSLLIEFKSRPITDFPDALIDASLILIQNTELLTVFVNIIFARTNIYDSVGMCTTMGIVTRWFNHIENEGLLFPSNFDFTFFLKGIEIALDQDHSVTVPRTLHLLYRTLHYLPIEQRNIIVKNIFKKHLYTLFFNWSFNIRDLFIAMFLYQIEYLYIVKTAYSLGHGINQALLNSGTPSAMRISQLARNSSRLNFPQMGEKGEEGLSREKIKAKRLEAIVNIQKCIAQYEQHLQQNPNEAEENFDRSVSMKRFRVASENIMNNHTSKQEASARQQSDSIFMNRGGQQVDGPPGEDKKQLLGLKEKKKMNQQGLTLNQFIKSHEYFNKFMEELAILEEYQQSQIKKTEITLTVSKREKSKNRKSRRDRSSSQTNEEVKEEVPIKIVSNVRTSNSRNPRFLQRNSNLEATNSAISDIDRRYLKVIAKIPQHLRIYIPHALEEFNKQLEEFEVWKASLTNSGAQAVIFSGGIQNGANAEFTIQKILPEFNMEKNMPIEDDGNLVKKEEW